MGFFHPGDVVCEVVDRRYTCQGCCERRVEDESKLHIVSCLITLPRECCPSQTVIESIDQGVRQRPLVTSCEAFRVVPNRRCRCVRKSWHLADVVFLIISSNKQSLAVS